MPEFTKGDKVRLTFEGIWDCNGHNHARDMVQTSCLDYTTRTLVKAELIEKAPNTHDFEADEYGTLYVDDAGNQWVKLATANSADLWYIRRVDSYVALESFRGLECFRKSTLKPL